MKGWILRLRTAFARLRPRERALVSAAGGTLLLVVVWFGVLTPLRNATARTGGEVEAAERDLQIMKRLRRDFDEVSQRLALVESRIQQGRPGNLHTTLEQLARKADVAIESMEPQSSPANSRYSESKVEVGLKQVSLPQTVRYLHEIESTPQVLSVKALRIRTRPDQPELLDVTFTVSSFEPVQATP